MRVILASLPGARLRRPRRRRGQRHVLHRRAARPGHRRRRTRLLYPVVTALAALGVLKERLRAVQAAGAGLALVGTVLLAGGLRGRPAGQALAAAPASSSAQRQQLLGRDALGNRHGRRRAQRRLPAALRVPAAVRPGRGPRPPPRGRAPLPVRPRPPRPPRCGPAARRAGSPRRCPASSRGRSRPARCAATACRPARAGRRSSGWWR